MLGFRVVAALVPLIFQQNINHKILCKNYALAKTDHSRGDDAWDWTLARMLR